MTEPDFIINDFSEAQVVVNRYLSLFYNKYNMSKIQYFKILYVPGSKRDLWEIEGKLILKKLYITEFIIFKLQIDPENSRIMGHFFDIEASINLLFNYFLIFIGLSLIICNIVFLFLTDINSIYGFSIETFSLTLNIIGFLIIIYSLINYFARVRKINSSTARATW